MATTCELIIHGKIQHKGFRDKIEKLGHVLCIDGIVYNYEDNTVRILVNFNDDEDIKKLFKNSIKIIGEKDNLIEIEKIEEKELNSYIEFPKGIDRISADDLPELNKKLDDGVKYIKLIFGELTEHKKILVNIDSGIGDVKSELTEHKKILVNIDSGIGDVKSEITEHKGILTEIKDILTEHKGVLTEMKDTQLKTIGILEKIEKKL